jgi:hypothetical protein
MDALPPGASLPRIGAIVYGAFLLLARPSLEAFSLPRVVKFSMRHGAPPRVGMIGGGGGVCLNASTMVGCREALSTIRGHGSAGRVSRAGSRMRRHRGAMERSKSLRVGIMDLRRRQEVASFQDSSNLK